MPRPSSRPITPCVLESELPTLPTLHEQPELAVDPPVPAVPLVPPLAWAEPPVPPLALVPPEACTPPAAAPPLPLPAPEPVLVRPPLA
jgi:hypothetical protein